MSYSREELQAPRAPAMNRQAWALLAAVVLLAAALRLWGLADRSFWYDEAAQLTMAEYAKNPADLFNLDYSNDPPLFPLLVRFWVAAVDLVPAAQPGTAWRDGLLRVMPLVFSLLAVPLLFFAARAILKENWTALLGALLFAVSPFQVYHAQELRAYSLQVALTVAALWVAARALEEGGWWRWSLLAALCAVAVYNNTFAVWFVAALSLHFLVIMRSHWRLIPQWTAWNIAVIVLVIPALWMAFKVNAYYEDATILWYLFPTWRTGLITIKDFFAGYGATRAAYLPLLGMALALMALGAYGLRGNPKALSLLLCVGLFPIAFNLVYANTRHFPYYTHRLMITSAAPLCLLAAAGLRQLRFHRAAPGAALALLLALTTPCLADYYKQNMHRLWEHTLGALHKPDNRLAADFIRPQLREGDVILHSTSQTLLPFYHYLDAKQGGVCLNEQYRYEVASGYTNRAVYQNWGVIPELVERAGCGAERIWFIQSYWQSWVLDPLSRSLIDWYDAHYIRVNRACFDGLTVYLYDTRPALKESSPSYRFCDSGMADDPAYAFQEAPEGMGAPERAGVACPACPESAHEGTSLVLSVEDPATGRFSLRNLTAEPRRCVVTVWESDATLEAVSFYRESPERSEWVIGPQYEPGPPEGFANTSAQTAILPREGSGDEFARRVVSRAAIPAGEYDLYFRMMSEASETRLWSADVEVHQLAAGGGAILAGTVAGNDPACTPGWGWRHVGRMAGQGGRLRVTAARPPELDIAYFHFERAVLLRAGEAAPPANPETARFEVDLAPGETKSLTYDVETAGGSRRVDIEACDPAGPQYFRVWFDRPTGPAAP